MFEWNCWRAFSIYIVGWKRCCYAMLEGVPAARDSPRHTRKSIASIPMSTKGYCGDLLLVDDAVAFMSQAGRCPCGLSLCVHLGDVRFLRTIPVCGQRRGTLWGTSVKAVLFIRVGLNKMRMFHSEFSFPSLVRARRQTLAPSSPSKRHIPTSPS